MRENALKINPDLAVFDVSCISGQGIEVWLDWIKEQLARKRSAAGQEEASDA
jgi:hydrogenase nickel incorporation protein HypB